MFFDLAEAIRRRLAEGLKDVSLRSPGPKQEFRTPVVKIAHGVKASPGKSEVPGVFIVPVSWIGTQTEGDRADVSLVCQAYTPEGSDEAAGLQELANLIGYVRAAIWSEPVLEKRYQVDGDMRLFVDLDLKHPFYRAEVTTSWRMEGLSPQMSPEDQARVFGEGFVEMNPLEGID